MESKATQKIDEVLFFLKTNKIWMYHNGGASVEIPKINEDIFEGDTELIRILKKLVSDGHANLKSDLESDGYLITYDGMLFKGYEYEDTVLRNLAFRNRAETVLLVYGTASAGVYGCFEILKWIVPHIQTWCDCYFWFQTIPK